MIIEAIRLLLLGFCLLPIFTWAQCPGSPPAGIDCVDTGASKNITAYSTCKKVTNSHAEIFRKVVDG